MNSDSLSMEGVAWDVTFVVLVVDAAAPSSKSNTLGFNLFVDFLFIYVEKNYLY